ncbi:MAG: hypothetical protein HN704_08365 [Bacteroidetes bacterium]|jgi:tRNA U54 and U55 pseudouridine synthase Pus10|nr:hypothetical protein [Bacteroidota bacterium]MBT6686417.1 hypothetical protein [Bacteroidota bacterium]MBT7142250.1 hypothetical protein [Bacteroidota bacterium]MBT7491606.1 hypothetical protein [Bacteroidota bacterium]
MTKTNQLIGFKEIVHVTTEYGKTCTHCNEQFDIGEFASFVNHYIQEHNFSLIHVGTETLENTEKGNVHNTVAVLGK